MKILFIHHGEVPGGAPTSLKNLLLLLLEYTDYELKVLCINEKMKNYFFNETNGRISVGDLPYPCKTFGKVFIWGDFIHIRKFKRFVLDIAYFSKSIRNQYRMLKEENPDIVHLNSSILVTTAIAAKKLGFPVIWHIREIIKGGKWNLRKLFIKKIINRLADIIVSISEEVEKNVVLKPTKSRIIYNFIDFRKFRPDPDQINKYRSIYNITEGSPVILSLGGVSHHKGTFEIVNAIQNLPSNTKIIIAGSFVKKLKVGSLHKLVFKIEDIFIYLRLKSHLTWNYNYRVFHALEKINNPNIVFTGFIKDVPSLISLSDLLIFAGTTPHFPRPVFEAWALKKPVIAFAQTGVSEYIDDGLDGILVKHINSKKLAEGINKVITRKDALEAMGEKGFKKAFELFDGRKNINGILKIYDEVYNNVNQL